jgi:hypothetical protein
MSYHERPPLARLSGYLEPNPASRRAATREPRRVAASVPVHAFRLPGVWSEPYWPGDDMGGTFDPGDPRLSRRDFLLRVAVTGAALTVGGALNVLTTALARQSLASGGRENAADERR